MVSRLKLVKDIGYQDMSQNNYVHWITILIPHSVTALFSKSRLLIDHDNGLWVSLPFWTCSHIRFIELKYGWEFKKDIQDFVERNVEGN